VTTEAASRTPAGEAGFRLLARRQLADNAHFGLIAMRERVEALGRRSWAASTPPA
jgi:signal transduction histidine kinase